MLRFLSLVFVLSAAPRVAAGPPAENKSPPNAPSAAPKASELSHGSLGRVLNARYAAELVPSKNDPPQPFYTLAMKYHPPKSKETLNWTVTCEVVERAGQTPLARLWFNCQVLPADIDARRVCAFLEWSGGHGVSRGFFKTSRHKDGTMLSLVVEAPPEDTTLERFPRVLDGLLLMAYETSPLWNGKLSEPLAKAAAKPPATAKDLTGLWSGKVYLDDKLVGDYAVTFVEGGIGTTVARANTAVDKPAMEILVGDHRIENGRLTLKMISSKAPDGYETNVYDAELEGMNLTLSMKQGSSVLKIQLARSESRIKLGKE